MPKISKKIALFTDSVIARMSRVANECGAINLAEGFPDFPPPLAMRQRLSEAALDGPHQYGLEDGAANLRQAMADCRQMFTGQTIDPEREIVVTCGGTEALMTAMMAVVDPGDKVILFSPFYEAYATDALLCGAEPIYVSLRGDDYTFDGDELEAAFKQHPKAIFLCNPSNPCGKVFSREELLTIAAMSEKYDTFVVVDEVYEHIVYAPTVYTYFSTLPGMYERTISCGSLSKTYSITGWRLGYVFAAPAVAEAIKQLHVYLTISAPRPLQEAAVVGLKFDRSYYEGLQAMYTKKRDFVMKRLDEIGISHNVPQGAFYMLVDIGGYGYDDDEAFCRDLAAKVGVALVPASSFFVEPVRHLARLQFAVRDETLAAAMERLEKISILQK
ncbi:pyridoxal phosphate-dependent aminotransferase [Megasphaera sp.]|uniref:pyridoxal phosphate-dependent aminotransferase n=1 Tax=Megasphaera sp. TaxID=2023260 RepID=UPI0025EF9133|nr:aminotransferase class I/II-fold pyridoxal phosphate-dependent enzyme [uncultured Megasphaera sp.]